MKLRNSFPLLVLAAFTFLTPSLFAIGPDAIVSGEESQPGIAMAATPCEDGMAGIYPCNKIDLLAFVPLASMGCTENGNVVEGWVDPTTDKEYALMGCNNGVSFLDVTNPESPIYLGRLPAHNNSNSQWRDIRVYTTGAAHRMYAGSEASGHGIQVFDLTRLRGVSSPQTFTEDGHYSGLGNSHTIFLNQNTGYLYAVGASSPTCSSGLHMINVQNPTPTFAGCFGHNRYTHEVTCVSYSGPDSTYAGHEICFAANGPDGELVVVDVTNKSAPVQLAAKTYPNSVSTYPHQVWHTEDQRYLLLNDEFDEGTFGVNTQTWLWDISDLNNPVLIGPYVHNTDAVDHNLYVKGNFVYESNYTSGLRILDLSDIANSNLEEIAFFDSYPQGDTADTNGMWDNYPYLPSGIILASGITGAPSAGLFILQPSFTPDFVLFTNDPLINACGTGSGQTTIDLEPRFGYTGTAAMSASGLPAGATASFNPLNVVIPGSTNLTVNLSGTPAGNYPFTVTATDGTISHILPLTLNVATVPPTSPALLHPENNSIDQPFVMHFEWLTTAGASSYDLQIAADPAFTNIIYTANTIEDHHTATRVLDPQTTYYWHVRANNACGSAPFGAPFQFTTGVPARILLVDDDNNSPDVLSFYTDALTTISETYNVWDTTFNTINGPQDAKHLDEPDASTMSNYDVVIWFSGDASGGTANPKAGPIEATETALSQYLNSGGCLAMISEDYFNDRGDVTTPFMSNYLGAGTINDNVNQTAIAGAGIFSGIGNITLQYPAWLSNLSDRIVPGTGAQLAFSGNQGTAAISKDAVNYRTVFMGFPLEAIPNANQRRLVLERVLNFCDGVEEPACLFCDDFENGVLDANWNYLKPSWQEVGGELVGTPSKRKAVAIAQPVFTGCLNCSIQTSVSVTGGIGSRASIIGWHLDKRNTVELLIKPENGTWVLKQRSNGTIVAKAKAPLVVNSGQIYNVKLTYNGTQFEVVVDGTSLITLAPKAAVNSGTVGFQAKETILNVGEINVD